MTSAGDMEAIDLEPVIEQIVATAAERIFQASQGGLPVARAWVFTKPNRKGFYVGWYDPDGHRRSRHCSVRQLADRFRRQVEAQLLTGTYGLNSNKTWAEFRERYERDVLASRRPATRRQALMSLGNFERIVGPGKVSRIKTETVDRFIAARRLEPSANWRTQEPPTISAASVNADLRNIRAALRRAKEWGYLEAVPVFRLLKEPRRLPVYVTPEHFAAMYAACDLLPEQQQTCQTGNWWRGFLVTAYMTGWRLGELLAMKRADLDLKAGLAVTRAESNKAGRDEAIALHPLVVDHLNRLQGFSELVFPWPHHRRTLYSAFQGLQDRAGLVLSGRKSRYSFHDLRRAFGTLNAPRLPARTLQQLMRHKSLQTTLTYYVNPMAEMQEAVCQLAVPALRTPLQIAAVADQRV